MKFATLRDGTRDGRLVVVSRDLQRAVAAGPIAPTLQAALDRWADCEPALRALAASLEAGHEDAMAFDPRDAMAPLPRTAQFVDASAYPSHGRLLNLAYQVDVKLAPGIPGLVQRQGDDFRGPCDDYELLDEDEDADIEGEFAVIVDDVPMASTPAAAEQAIRLVVLLDDISARRHLERELATGFGAINLKPATVFAPVAVTPDELGEGWADGRVQLDLHVHRNGEWIGQPNGREMAWRYGDLLARLAYNRRLRAGTVVAGGTVSNQDAATVGSACLAERRVLEQLQHGAPRTPFLRFGDVLRMEALLPDGGSVFGAMDHRIVPLRR